MKKLRKKCVCDHGTWVGKPLPICERYVAYADHTCVYCYHDRACHYPKVAAAMKRRQAKKKGRKS